MKERVREDQDGKFWASLLSKMKTSSVECAEWARRAMHWRNPNEILPPQQRADLALLSAGGRHSSLP